jgi:crotonobetainyl-CoA:carnitine CoA-transferase CaiB-like acyl-CoA transferase
MTPHKDALSGLKVLDFSIMMAGPYCGRLLADLGADVVKIELPEGDDMRLRTPLRAGQSTYVGQLNAGKRSLPLDLKKPVDLATAMRLVERADVVLENFRPGVMDRMGLGAATLRERNPRLVYCSVSGYGQHGPSAQKAAYAMMLIVPITPRNFTALAEVTGLDALRGDARFASMPARNANWQAMMQLVQTWTQKRTTAQCIEALEAAGVPCARYAEPGDALNDPHLRERGIFEKVADSAGEFLGVNAPWHMSGTDSRLRAGPPAVGEHRSEVLEDWLSSDAA